MDPISITSIEVADTHGFTPYGDYSQLRSSSTPLAESSVEKSVTHQALLSKEEGNSLFRTSHFVEAITSYSKAIDLIAPFLPEPEKRHTPSRRTSKDNRDDKDLPTHITSENPVDPEPKTPLSPDVVEMIEISAACLSNRAACHTKLQNYADVVTDCNEALQRKPDYVKALQRRAEACDQLAQKAIAASDSVEASGKLDMAVADCRRIIELDPSNAAARLSLLRLEPELKRQNEIMKDEMIGKLKGFGNFLLGKVGLSLDNFKAEQDPVTGSYNIQFQQNK